MAVCGFAMIEVEAEAGTAVALTAEMVRAQLDLMVQDDVFRSSKRSVAFLRYVVEQTLNGSASQIKERTIGVEVFDRKPTYDTNLPVAMVGSESIPAPLKPEHTALELQPQLHGLPEPLPDTSTVHRRRWGWMVYAACAVMLVCAGLGYGWMHRTTSQDLFWKPVLDTPGPVLVAIGDVPDGPPTAPAPSADGDNSAPVLRPPISHGVPFGDAVTMARVVGALEKGGKKVMIRKEGSSSFSDLREGPAVLIGAFNNEWSLRLTRPLRYNLALDSERHLIYIRDSQNPASREWSWGTNLPTDHRGGPHSPALHDYALISRIRNSETGKVVVVIGGLYTYGTQSAGEFLTDPQMMQAISAAVTLDPGHPDLQIVLGTTVTDEAPGPPKVLAISKQ